MANWNQSIKSADWVPFLWPLVVESKGFRLLIFFFTVIGDFILEHCWPFPSVGFEILTVGNEEIWIHKWANKDFGCDIGISLWFNWAWVEDQSGTSVALEEKNSVGSVDSVGRKMEKAMSNFSWRQSSLVFFFFLFRRRLYLPPSSSSSSSSSFASPYSSSWALLGGWGHRKGGEWAGAQPADAPFNRFLRFSAENIRTERRDSLDYSRIPSKIVNSLAGRGGGQHLKITQVLLNDHLFFDSWRRVPFTSNASATLLITLPRKCY